jgi:putative transcriptional regulator
MAVHVRLKEVRTSRGVSQNELVRRVGMSLQGLQKIEYGKASGIQFNVLEKLCSALECLPGDLSERIPDEETVQQV